ncbi:hypothetical protein F4820DRAFT_240437 [Hypoxylon rubiginosum]|uniref:Uncharacterized protein n=1 Tax=Hypoxylon rubiginosum TaxID=110542 RepID=A0ACB9Z5A6_9PEZI|nr:hypothetical protein F4820DRAFT_240437 [Hypoxylon rubiginosum]
MYLPIFFSTRCARTMIRRSGLLMLRLGIGIGSHGGLIVTQIKVDVIIVIVRFILIGVVVCYILLGHMSYVVECLIGLGSAGCFYRRLDFRLRRSSGSLYYRCCLGRRTRRLIVIVTRSAKRSSSKFSASAMVDAVVELVNAIGKTRRCRKVDLDST